MMYAYRSSVHESTNETPAMMMLGREVELPVDLLYGKPPTDETHLERTSVDYLENLWTRMWAVHDLARKQMTRASDRQKRHYDLNASTTVYKPGDAVWVYNTRLQGGSRKLTRPWEGPYIIIQQLSDLVYKVKRAPRSKVKIVNMQKLKPYLGRVKKWFVPSSDRILRP